MNKTIWSTAAFLSLFSFHLYYVNVLQSDLDPVKSCEKIMDKIGSQKKLVRLASPGQENSYRFYNLEHIKAGFEKRPDFIVGEASVFVKDGTDFECKVTLYN